MLEFMKQQRPNSKWVVDLITIATFYVNKIQAHPIGCGVTLPTFIKKNKAIISLAVNHGDKGQLYTDNLCLFRCLACYMGVGDNKGRGLERVAKEMFRQWREQHPTNEGPFEGVTLEELPDIELQFKVNINVFELVEEENADGSKQVVAQIVQRSHRTFDRTVNLNLYESHFSYIQDLSMYSKSYGCRKCGKLFHTLCKLTRHEKGCEVEVRRVYPGGVYHRTDGVFELLEDEGIHVPHQDRVIPFCAVFDFEAYLDQTNLPPSASKSSYTNRHVPLSVSVASNVPGYEDAKCFITDGDPYKLVQNMVDHLHDIQSTTFDALTDKYQWVFDQLDEHIQMAETSDPAPPPCDDDDDDEPSPHPLERLKDRFTNYLKELTVVGFNSGKYDLNMVKKYLIAALEQKDKDKDKDRSNIYFTVKKNNDYMCLKTARLKFVDIQNYLAPDSLTTSI